jgi:hypothetical protein
MMKFAGFFVLGVVICITSFVSAQGEGRLLYLDTEGTGQYVFDCWAQKKIQKAILPIWYETLVSFATDNIKGAKAAQIPSIDVYWYLTPAVMGNSPADIPLQGIKSALASVNITNATVWMLVWGADRASWFPNQADNQAYILKAVSVAQSLGLQPLIFSVSSQWNAAVGSWSDPSLTSLPVGYLSQNSQQDFNDWAQSSFGGWTAPSYKDYKYMPDECITSSDAVYWKTSEEEI